MRAFVSSARSFISRSPMCMAPASRCRRPHTMRIVVVLPAPLGPSNPYVSPSAIVRLTSSTATRSPNRLVRFSQRRTIAMWSSWCRGSRPGRAEGPCPPGRRQLGQARSVSSGYPVRRAIAASRAGWSARSVAWPPGARLRRADAQRWSRALAIGSVANAQWVACASSRKRFAAFSPRTCVLIVFVNAG